MPLHGEAPKNTGPAEIMIRRWKSEAREIFQEKKRKGELGR